MAKRGGLELYLFGSTSLELAMHRLEKTMQKKIMRKALREEAKRLRETIREKVPKDTGNLAKKMQVRSMRRSRVRFGVVVRTPPADKLKGIPRTPNTKKPGYYPAHLELGTKRQAAKPYMRPSLDAHREGLLDRVGRDLWVGLKQEAAKTKARVPKVVTEAA